MDSIQVITPLNEMSLSISLLLPLPLPPSLSLSPPLSFSFPISYQPLPVCRFSGRGGDLCALSASLAGHGQAKFSAALVQASIPAILLFSFFFQLLKVNGLNSNG